MTDIQNLPPSDVKIERFVLGTLMMEKTAIHKVANRLWDECFYLDTNRSVFQAISAVHQRGDIPDMLNTMHELKKMGSGIDVVFLAELTSSVGSGESIESHSVILVEHAIRRKLLGEMLLISKRACDQTEDVLGLLSTAQNMLAEASGNIAGQKFKSIRDLVLSNISDIEERMQSEKPFSGIDICSTHLNRKFGGWQKGDLIILAGRPGMMKTGVVLDMIRKMATTNSTPCAFFSLEMPSSHIVNRWLGQESSIPYGSVQKHKLTSDQYTKVLDAGSTIGSAPLYVDDASGITVEYLRSKLYKWKIEHGIEVVVIDYLQLMTAGKGYSGNREGEISHISRNLKIIAKELDLSIIALAQLSRAVESRADKRPQLSDLRESGSIEQDADGVVFLLRPSYYGITEDENGNDLTNTLEMIVSKNRHGGLGSLLFTCDPSLSTYSDLLLMNEF